MLLPDTRENALGFANDKLELNEVTIRNFRKFESYSIDFERQLTVLVGDNGAGKSTLIDAACIALGVLFQRIENAKAPGMTSDDARGAVIKQGDMFDVQSQYPITVEASGIVLGNSAVWERSINKAKGRITQANASGVIDAGDRLQKLVSDGEEVVLPILARYGTDRLWKQVGGSKDKPSPNRTRGYEDALQASANEARMNAWFKSQSIWEWQNKRESALFSAAKKALASCFDAAAATEGAMVDYDAELDQLVFTYSTPDGVYHRDRMHSMSDGYRGTLSLFADIAYRMATLNPALGERVLETPGVVMVDEIDLHLHPRWQARILEDLIRIFPNVQFIVTTHSPVVVASVPRNNIRVLGAEAATVPITETHGRDAGDILNTVLGASSRPEEAARLFDLFGRAVDEGRFGDAKAELDKLEAFVGQDDPDVVAAKTTLELEELLS